MDLGAASAYKGDTQNIPTLSKPNSASATKPASVSQPTPDLFGGASVTTAPKNNNLLDDLFGEDPPQKPTAQNVTNDDDFFSNINSSQANTVPSQQQVASMRK